MRLPNGRVRLAELHWRGSRSKNLSPRFVVCVDNSGYEASLEVYRIYTVVPDQSAAQDGDLRIVDESGEDYLFAAARFLEIDVPKALERVMLKKAS